MSDNLQAQFKKGSKREFAHSDLQGVATFLIEAIVEKHIQASADVLALAEQLSEAGLISLSDWHDRKEFLRGKLTQMATKE